MKSSQSLCDDFIFLSLFVHFKVIIPMYCMITILEEERQAWTSGKIM